MSLEYKLECEALTEISDIFEGNMAPPDFYVYSDTGINGLLEAKGVRGFNSVQAIDICRDKLKSYCALSKFNIPQPKTFMVPSNYSEMSSKQIDDFYNESAEILGVPFVGKVRCGSMGEGIRLISNKQEFEDFMMMLDYQKTKGIISEFISEAFGEDFRFQVIGNEVVNAYGRRSNDPGEFRANVHLGGSRVEYHPTQDEIELAVKAARICGCDFAGVDIIHSDKGPVIIELNTLPQFPGTTFAEQIMGYVNDCMRKERN